MAFYREIKDEKLDEVEASLSADKLLKPAKMAELLGLSKHKEDAVRTLHRVVEAAKRDRKTRWLQGFAHELDVRQVYEREWISQHVHDLGPAAPPKVWNEAPTGQSRDFRLTTDPTLQRTGEFLEEIGKEEEDRLLESSEGEAMEVEVTLSGRSTSSPPARRSSPSETEIERAAPSHPSQGPQSVEGTAPPQLSQPSAGVKAASPHLTPPMVKPVSPVKPMTRAPELEEERRGESKCPSPRPGTSTEPKGTDRGQDKDRGEWTVQRSRKDKQKGRCPSQAGRKGAVQGDRRRLDASPVRQGQRTQDRRKLDASPKRQERRGGPSRQGQVGQGRRKQEDRRKRDASRGNQGQEKKVRLVVSEPAKQEQARSATATCPVPSCRVGETEGHAFESHLPGVFHLAVSGADIANRRVGALKLVMRWILGAQSTLQDLIRYVECAGVIPATRELSEQMTMAMGELCMALGIQTPADLSIRMSGNHVTALLHWRVMLALMSLLEPHQVASLRELFSLTKEEEKLLPRLPEGFDSHCHLDRVSAQFNMENPTLQEICNRQWVDPMFVVEMSGVVGVFCDPETYPTKDQLLNWCRQGVVPAIGLHPKKDMNDDVIHQMRDLLALPQVVGFGEVGLDRTLPPDTWMDQLLKLEKVLLYLEARHVLILHCRGLTRNADETLTTMLHLLVARGVPTDQRIHLHCFCGTALSVKMWLERFPNTYFGFSLMVRGYDLTQDSRLIDGILKVPSTRVLLETDAPYFRPAGTRRSVASHIGVTASEVAKIRGEKWEDLLATTVANAKALYMVRSGNA